METKLSKNDILDLLSESALADARMAYEACEEELKKASYLKPAERLELVALGTPENDATLGRYYGTSPGDVSIWVTVQESKLPDWYRKRRQQVAAIEARQAQLRRSMDNLRDNRTRRIAVVQGLLEQTKEGKVLLDQIKGLTITINPPKGA